MFRSPVMCFASQASQPQDQTKRLNTQTCIKLIETLRGIKSSHRITDDTIYNKHISTINNIGKYRCIIYGILYCFIILTKIICKVLVCVNICVSQKMGQTSSSKEASDNESPYKQKITESDKRFINNKAELPPCPESKPILTEKHREIIKTTWKYVHDDVQKVGIVTFIG